MHVLVIGAGVAGLTAARAIAASGHAVHVADRAPVPGGRVATRRVLDGDADRPEHAMLAFDHGAQYFTARDARFAAAVDAWRDARKEKVAAAAAPEPPDTPESSASAARAQAPGQWHSPPAGEPQPAE